MLASVDWRIVSRNLFCCGFDATMCIVAFWSTLMGREKPPSKLS